MTDAARIMIYSQDSYGLGHLRRTTNVANELAARREDLTVLMAVDSPVAPFFELHERIDFVKLPTVVKVDAGVFQPARLLTSYELVKTMRTNVLKELIRQFRPHLVLVDHMPGGANRELVPALEMIRNEAYPTKLVLGLRDIIDRPEVTCDYWTREGVYDTIERFYDWVLIYGASEVFPTAEAYRIPERVCEKIQYCGYICNMDPIKDPRRIRAKLGLDDEPMVAAMAGGGADAFGLMQTFLDSVRLLSPTERFATVMITGPFMPEAERRALREQAKSLGVNIHTTVGDTMSHINAADVVVTMAGYNTLLETMRFQKKVIVVPRPGPSAEQTMRAGLFAERGLVQSLEQPNLSPFRLAEEIRIALRAPNGGRPILPGLNGVAEATEAILDALPPSRYPIGAANYHEMPTVTASVTAMSERARKLAGPGSAG